MFNNIRNFLFPSHVEEFRQLRAEAARNRAQMLKSAERVKDMVAQLNGEDDWFLERKYKNKEHKDAL